MSTQVKATFKTTPEGCTAAREFLVANGKGWFIDNVLTTDGYTIVSMSNKLMRKLDE